MASDPWIPDKLHVFLANEVDAKSRRLIETENKLNEAMLALRRVTEMSQLSAEENESLKLEIESIKKGTVSQKDPPNIEAEDDIMIEGHTGKKVFKTEEEDDLQAQIIALMEVHEEREAELESVLTLNNILTTRELRSNRELQEARKILINGIENFSSQRSTIGIKRMGELNDKPFRNACIRRFPREEADMKAAELCSIWDEVIRNPEWYPFKNIGDGEECKEVIDEEDEKLQALRNEWGEEVYNAVVTTLMEINEYNPSGRFPVPELWNFKEESRASLKEVIQFLLTKLKNLKAIKSRH